MARYMSTQYLNKNIDQRSSKKGDRNRKKGDDPKSKEKNNNATGTVGAHVWDVITPKDSTSGSSIGTHVSEATKQPSHPTQSVEDLLGAYSIDDAIRDRTNLWDVSVDTANSKEVMTGNHTTEQHTFKFRISDQHSS